MMASASNGWTNEWVSYAEMAKLGGNVKGQSATKIEIPMFKKKKDPVTGDERETLTGFRAGVIFNIAQVDGVELPSKEAPKLVESVSAVLMMQDRLKEKGVKFIENAGNGCSYDSLTDTVEMPNRGCFDNAYEYYAQLAHEMAHATMSYGRVEREPVSYAYEELRAEMASALICSSLRLPRTQNHIDNHASFMQAWLEEFADKKGQLLKAASEAQQIHDYLMELAQVKEEELLAA